MADPCSLRRATGSAVAAVGRPAGLLTLLGGLFGRCAQLRRHRLGQLHRQWGADRHRGISTPNNGVRQRIPGFSSQRHDFVLRAIHDASNHPAIAVNADEPDDAGRLVLLRLGHADHLATPRAVLDADLGHVLAQRFGQFRRDLAPQARGLRRGVGGDREAAVGRHHPHGAGHAHLGELDLYLSGLGHRNQHRAEVQPGQRRRRRIVEVVDVEGPSSSSTSLMSCPHGLHVGRSLVIAVFVLSECHFTNSHVRRRNRGRRRHGMCRPSRPRRTTSPRPARAARPVAPAAGRSGLRDARRSASSGSG